MNVVGVVAEFDPFHNGHEYLLEKAKSFTDSKHAVTALGGNFSQRGNVSLLSKAAKTECALAGGFDLVLELPVTFALSSAERFAFGGVSVLAAAGVVTHIAFGSECGDAELLSRIADALTRSETVDEIKLKMKDGTAFASAREAVVGDMLGDAAKDALRNPNDILGVEYIKAIKKLNANITPVAVKRVGSDHDSADAVGKYASASAIRSMISGGKDASPLVPKTTADIIARERENGDLRTLDGRAVLARLRAMTADEISRLPEVREGMENRIKEAARCATDLKSFAEAVSGRRYTLASARRIALYALLGITKESIPSSPGYVRILGAGADAADLLKALKKSCSLPLITKPADSRILLETESTASDIAAVFAQKIRFGGDEFVKYPIFKKK